MDQILRNFWIFEEKDWNIHKSQLFGASPGVTGYQAFEKDSHNFGWTPAIFDVRTKVPGFWSIANWKLGRHIFFWTCVNLEDKYIGKESGVFARLEPQKRLFSVMFQTHRVVKPAGGMTGWPHPSKKLRSSCSTRKSNDVRRRIEWVQSCNEGSCWKLPNWHPVYWPELWFWGPSIPESWRFPGGFRHEKWKLGA